MLDGLPGTGRQLYRHLPDARANARPNAIVLYPVWILEDYDRILDFWDDF